MLLIYAINQERVRTEMKKLGLAGLYQKETEEKFSTMPAIRLVLLLFADL